MKVSYFVLFCGLTYIKVFFSNLHFVRLESKYRPRKCSLLVTFYHIVMYIFIIHTGTRKALFIYII